MNISVEASTNLRSWRALPPEFYDLSVVNNDLDVDQSAVLVRLTLPITLRQEAFRLKVELSSPANE